MDMNEISNDLFHDLKSDIGMKIITKTEVIHALIKQGTGTDIVIIANFTMYQALLCFTYTLIHLVILCYVIYLIK